MSIAKSLGQVVVLLMLAALIGGCGGSGGDESNPPPDVVYDASEPNGFISCLETDPETGEQYTAEFANDELEVVFDHATLDEVDSAFAAIGAHKKRYMTWLSTWVAGLDTPATTCEELQAKVDLLKAQPKVVSVWKNQRYSIPVVP